MHGKIGARAVTAAIGALLALGVLGVTGADAKTVFVDDDAPVDVAGCGASAATACRTIGWAVAREAVGGDTIRVAPGRYDIDTPGGPGMGAFLEVDKTLRFEGAQAGVDARARQTTPAQESVIEDFVTTPPTGFLMFLDADDVTVDGFTFQGNPNGRGVEGDFSHSGHTIVNNVFRDNEIGIEPSGNAVRQTLIEHNLFDANTRILAGTGSWDIYSDNVAGNILIDQNRFIGNPDNNPILFTGSVNRQAGITVTDNDFVGTQRTYFVDLSDLSYVGNRYSSPRGGVITLGGGVAGALIADNLMDGHPATPVVVNNESSVRPNTDVRVLRNTIVDSAPRAIAVGGDDQGTIDVHYNRIVDNEGIGLVNDSPTAVVRADRNWWGCNDGPLLRPCDLLTGSAAAATGIDPWLVLSLDADPLTIPPNTSSTLTGSVANLSSGGIAPGPFFHSGVISFAADPPGYTVNPVSRPLDGNVQGSSAYTSGPQRVTELRDTVDHQTVRIVFTYPPEPIIPPPQPVVPPLEPTAPANGMPGEPAVIPPQPFRVLVPIVNQGNRHVLRLRACLTVARPLRVHGRHRFCWRIRTLRVGHAIYRLLPAHPARRICRSRVRVTLRLYVDGRLQPHLTQRARVRIRTRLCGRPQPVTG